MLVSAASSTFDVDVVVFDKDGTLLSLDSYWLAPSRTWITHAADGDAELTVQLEVELGLIPTESGHQLDPDGPLATASLEDLVSLTRRVLGKFGIGFDETEQRTRRARTSAAEHSARLAPVAIGDVRAALTSLARAGLGIAIATTDDALPTHEALDALGIADLVDFVVTADGDIPSKPHRLVLATIASHFGLVPDRLLMVGDSVKDAETAANGGAAGFVLVSADRRARVRADAVVRSVSEIRPVPSQSP
ncbi:MAG TPA: HAD family hydrolase [Acidimicrobiia bacterium]|nr:HAD family hydrolase [Acidimicrobiia bacterium]